MKTTRIGPHFLLAVLTAILSVAVFAQQTPTPPAPNADQLREHITYLASDKMDGRRTGTDGAREASRYIAEQFKKLGLKPARTEVSLSRARGAVGYSDSYFQTFPYVVGVELGKRNELRFTYPAGPTSTPGAAVNQTSARLIAGDDWMPLGLSSNGRIENAPAVIVGYGINATELNYNDYAKADVKGKVAIAFAGTPDGANPHGQFARFEGVRWKAIAARNAGARALIVIASEPNFKEDRLSRLRYDHSAGDAGLPVVAISRTAAARLFEANGVKNFEEFATRMSQTLAQQGTQDVRGYSVSTTVKFELLTNTRVTIATDLAKHEVGAGNVIGILEGADPNLKNEAIILGAHYDHLGRGGDGSLAAKEGEIHHGADDNASGTAGLIELARLLSRQTPKPRRTVVFIAFSGEEEGLLGSNYYVNHPVIPLANTIAMINLDMIGRLKNNRLMVGGVGTAQDFRSMVAALNLAMGVTVTTSSTSPKPTSTRGMPIVVGANGQTVVTSDPGAQFALTFNEDGFGPSDHSSFYAKQIPVLFIWTGTHEDYHKPSDTADKINYEGEVQILRLVARIVNDIDQNDYRPVYTVAKTESSGRSMGFRVYLGTIPNYADSSDGLLLDGVREDSPAAKAGLKAGDKIVKLAGREVRNVYDYTYALGEMKAGEEYEVDVLRNGERMTLKITPTARK
ncbi:MAG TPA: M20/M25/M40 family metallo-hydrolase [Pyrinomonadaceae bacterium]|nr:M20/M25/M40 family metallo-hydrolase [Pyrinomonadaceae bacterium]